MLAALAPVAVVLGLLLGVLAATLLASRPRGAPRLDREDALILAALGGLVAFLGWGRALALFAALAGWPPPGAVLGIAAVLGPLVAFLVYRRQSYRRPR